MLANRLCLLTVCRPPRPLQDFLHPVLQPCIRRGELEGQGGQNGEGGRGDQAELAGPVPQNHCRWEHKHMHREGQGERGPRPARTHSRRHSRGWFRSKFIVKLCCRYRVGREFVAAFCSQVGMQRRFICEQGLWFY